MSDGQIIIEPIRRYELDGGQGIVIGRYGFILTEDQDERREHRGTWEYREYGSVSRHETMVKLHSNQESRPSLMHRSSDKDLFATSVEDAEALERDLQAGLRGELRSY